MELPPKVPDEDVRRVVDFISQRRGLDLSSYRCTFIYRHLRGRMADTQAGNYLEYIERLRRDPDELQKLLHDLSINVTQFFRDADVFAAFRNLVVPALTGSGNPHKRLVRIWSAACASGQEPYSIAMLMSEACAGRDLTVRIIGTDVDAEALDKAGKGRYTEEELKSLPDRTLVGKYFDRDGDAFTVKESLRQIVRFERHNLISDPPLKFVDVIFCRNVMIYFNRELQDALMVKFAQGLNPNGWLVIAKVETVHDKALFCAVDPIRKIFRKV
jgi:chemotaxis methyl-accepting protein methylase